MLVRARALAVVALVACGGSRTVPALDCTPSDASAGLRGVVLDAKTHAPVQTSIMLKSACSLGQPRYAIADDHGAYFFAGLPADSYDVFVAGAVKTTPARVRIGSTDMTVDLVVER